MPIHHTVRQGEYLAKICRQHGFPDWQKVWDNADNADLKSKRKSPNVLYPGDVVVIPDAESGEESGATEQRHTFKAKGRTLKLVLFLKDYHDQPIKDMAGSRRHSTPMPPVEELSGIRARLNNLGYDAGEKDESVQLQAAIEEFQCDNDQTVDGVCGPNTQGKLRLSLSSIRRSAVTGPSAESGMRSGFAPRRQVIDM